MQQEIKFCNTYDGVSLAYAVTGSGPPFVKVANWMNHLEYDLQSPVWSHLFSEISRDHQLIRYDERGTGLSDRSVDNLSLESLVADLEAVVDSNSAEQFPLFAVSQGGPVAIAYTVRHPEKVSHLIMLGSFPAGWRVTANTPEVLAKREAQQTLIRQGWNSKNPAFRQMWTTLCIPDGNEAERDSFNELQRSSATAEAASRIFEAIGNLDVRDLLREVQVPTLICHARNDAVVPFEEGRRMASMMPVSKFVQLDSNNHILLQREPAYQKFLTELRTFIGKPLSLQAQPAITYRKNICPTCGRTYDEDGIFYCLDDGTKLEALNSGDSDDDHATKILSDRPER